MNINDLFWELDRVANAAVLDNQTREAAKYALQTISALRCVWDLPANFDAAKLHERVWSTHQPE
jgi:hypothetical protein